MFCSAGRSASQFQFRLRLMAGQKIMCPTWPASLGTYASDTSLPGGTRIRLLKIGL